jgi:8-oxo-dGTP pyrophosphatase MutT (NUDIX family)
MTSAEQSKTADFSSRTVEQSSSTSNSSSSTSSSSSRLNTSYCNNCGITGHIFNNCKFPITSVGIVAFRYNLDDQMEYLLIRRKDTIGYIEFMRGKYSLNNKLYLLNIISEMTRAEKTKLLEHDFDTLWYGLWGDCVSNQFRSEEKNARDKFEALKLGIVLNPTSTNSPTAGNSYSLQSLIQEAETDWLEPEWGFPKGRHNNLEKDLMCGLREFEEETGYPAHSVKVIQNILPYEEIFTGSNYKSYKHKYYVGYINTLQEPQKPYQATEISKLAWCTYEQALELIRPYNLEKLAMLEKINKVLNTFHIHF